jgi:geranylgeranyl reductase family protein
MTRLRVAVIGAGPAGSSAARLLAARGAQVSLFEARRLPRPKTCGGGLTPKAQRLVPPAALGTIERRVDRVELRGRHLAALQLSVPDASIAMVERARFDLALVEEAARAGAVVRDEEPVRELFEYESGIELRTDRGRWQGDLLVVADGEPSAAARRLGLGVPARRRALAIEVDVPFGTAVPPDTAILDYRIPGGYGWYFPKGDHANLGVGSYRTSRHPRLRQDLALFADELGLDLQNGRVRGHWIAQGLRSGPLASRRAVLTGDAAATADALFGEGISYAIVSGVAAAQTIADWAEGSIDGLQPYDARLRALLAPALDRLDVIARTAELSITGALLAIRVSGRAREQAVDAITGRREPFFIDGHCAFACACELHGTARSPIPTGSDRTSVPSSAHCRRCTTACAA